MWDYGKEKRREVPCRLKSKRARKEPAVQIKSGGDAATMTEPVGVLQSQSSGRIPCVATSTSPFTAPPVWKLREEQDLSTERVNNDPTIEVFVKTEPMEVTWAENEIPGNYTFDEANTLKVKISGLKLVRIEGLTMWECSECPKKLHFSNVAEFVCHTIKSHRNRFILQCDECLYAFNEEHTLDHAKFHDGLQLSLVLSKEGGVKFKEAERWVLDSYPEHPDEGNKTSETRRRKPGRPKKFEEKNSGTPERISPIHPQKLRDLNGTEGVQDNIQEADRWVLDSYPEHPDEGNETSETRRRRPGRPKKSEEKNSGTPERISPIHPQKLRDLNGTEGVQDNIHMIGKALKKSDLLNSKDSKEGNSRTKYLHRKTEDSKNEGKAMEEAEVSSIDHSKSKGARIRVKPEEDFLDKARIVVKTVSSLREKPGDSKEATKLEKIIPEKERTTAEPFAVDRQAPKNNIEMNKEKETGPKKAEKRKIGEESVEEMLPEDIPIKEKIKKHPDSISLHVEGPVEQPEYRKTLINGQEVAFEKVGGKYKCDRCKILFSPFYTAIKHFMGCVPGKGRRRKYRL